MFRNPVRHITSDALDPYATASFWSAVTGWAVLADPEGNELCIERSASERG
ncbi:hypothetical protein [Streptomyces sp. NPDC090445]|uniref:hypothetical protein n=1 Tax=Streptomyces sp. NPDC090445 TaxID=3365963 RepID=UPI003825CB89